MIKLASLLTEITQRQKELKKDYLFRQSKLHSSNTVPSWDEMWKNIQHSGDGFARNIEDLKDDADRAGLEFDEEAAIREIENIQREKYFGIVQEYKYLDGKKCWRRINIPHNVDPLKLNQLGVYWAVEEEAAEAHWARHESIPTIECTFEGVIDLDVVDWPGTMFSRMDYTLGDDEQEIRFLKNAKLFINAVTVNKRLHSQKYPINAERRL